MDKKPAVTPINAQLNDEGQFKPRHFWAVKVYNYNTNQIEVCEITQKNIQGAIATFANDAEYGHPRGYDIVINRTGDKFETKYQVMPKPPKAVSAEVKKADADTQVNLQALFTGGNPFEFDAFAEAEREVAL